MSRIGLKPINIPQGVSVDVNDGNVVTVKGPKGELQQTVSSDLRVIVEDGVTRVERPSEDRVHRSQHGLARTLIANMVTGVSEGYQKVLEIHGVGYRATMEGQDLVISVGYSHPVRMKPPEGVKFELGPEDRSRIVRIIITGIDKQKVGQIAADVRKVRKPDAYKGKGIRYQGETIRLKQGKRASA